MKKICKSILLILLFAFFYKNSHAINMDSTGFSIKFGNINIGSKPESSTNYKLSTTMGQTSAGEFTSSGYTVKAGFQYIHSIIPFSFTVSNTNIDFGRLVSNTFSTRTTDLTVSFGSAGNYQVTAYEDAPMKTLGSLTIPDTGCNGGAFSCDENNANLWNDVNTYGFGYKVTGEDVPNTFTTCYSTNGSECYRRFSDKSASENPVIIMSSLNITGNTNPLLKNKHQSTVTFKINTSPIQAAGTYQANINFIATPSY